MQEKKALQYATSRVGRTPDKWVKENIIKTKGYTAPVVPRQKFPC